MAGGNLLMARMESGFGEDRKFMVSARGVSIREISTWGQAVSRWMAGMRFSNLIESGFSLDGSRDPRLGIEV
jgi:hypothetical protein